MLINNKKVITCLKVCSERKIGLHVRPGLLPSRGVYEAVLRMRRRVCVLLQSTVASHLIARYKALVHRGLPGRATERSVHDPYSLGLV